MRQAKSYSRRAFLQTAAISTPSVTLLKAPERSAAAAKTRTSAERFFPVDLRNYYNASSTDLGSFGRAKAFSQDGLIRTPKDKQKFRGIPFWLGTEGDHRKSWLVLSKSSSTWTTPQVKLTLKRNVNYVCLAQFCTWIPTPFHDGIVQVPFTSDATGNSDLYKVGQVLAELVLVYQDGEKRTLPIRRRFEVSPPSLPLVDSPFAAVPHYRLQHTEPASPLNKALDWGNQQRGLRSDRPEHPIVWLCALANPDPEKIIDSLEIQASGEDLLVICGLTLFTGQENPLRYERVKLYRFSLPEPLGQDRKRWNVEVDLGIVARTYALESFDSSKWLSAPVKGIGRPSTRVRSGSHLYAEVTASPDAVLTLRNDVTGQMYEFDVQQIVPDQESPGRPAGSKASTIEQERMWIHGQVIDSNTGGPTPARLAFYSSEGRYIPPCGHRAEINDGWFQDYGADLKLGDDSFAYVDGKFQIELPVGEVYLEVTKGFEYEPIRKKLIIKPGQRDLTVEIGRLANLRSKGWVTADTHVHFLSPTTAVLEAQAEGLNLVHLLAAQWGELFTNVGDLSFGPIRSRDGEAIVSVGQENYQHLLGHMSLLGFGGDAINPMTGEGTWGIEGPPGDPMWNSLSEWADECHNQDGLVVAAHFPYVAGELATDIVNGKIDAVELVPYKYERSGSFDLHFYDWYHCLNAGYRLPAVGGSDKMGAYLPVGANRTYTYLGQEEFSLANWSKAIRRGNTFSTTGPLLLFSVENHVPGDQINLGTDSATLNVAVEVQSFVPFHRLEVVYNGQVVTSREERAGTREMRFKEQIQVPGPGWLAARCFSQLSWPSWFAVAAHTSPVYLVRAGEELLSASSASYLLKLINGAESYVQNLAIRPDRERFDRILKVFRDARAELHRRMHQHGIPH